MRTPFDKTPYLEQDTCKIFHAISDTNAINLASLREFVSDYFQKVKVYNKL